MNCDMFNVILVKLCVSQRQEILGNRIRTCLTTWGPILLMYLYWLQFNLDLAPTRLEVCFMGFTIKLSVDKRDETDFVFLML